MSKRDRFYIDIYNLKNGVHQYDFLIDDNFFETHENNFIEHGKGEAMVTIDKTDSLINATFEINVNVELTCDRSLDKFDYPIRLEERMMFKYGEEEQELDVDVHVITKETQRINIGQHLFDYIALAVPYKKIHPRYQDDEQEQDELFFQTSPEDEEENNAEDPRWEALKKLKDKE